MINVKGLSVLEVLITLFVTCLLLGIGSFCLKGYQEDIVFANTLREISIAIEQGSRVSLINNDRVEINYFSKSNLLLLKGKGFERRISIDPSIHIHNLDDFAISEKGMIAPRTIIFSNGHRKQEMRIQMVWGKVLYE